jgi:hypothetical protein
MQVAIGVIGLFSVILSARGLWSPKSMNQWINESMNQWINYFNDASA